MDVLPAPDGAVMMMILLGIAICKEKKRKLVYINLRVLTLARFLIRVISA